MVTIVVCSVYNLRISIYRFNLSKKKKLTTDQFGIWASCDYFFNFTVLVFFWFDMIWYDHWVSWPQCLLTHCWHLLSNIHYCHYVSFLCNSNIHLPVHSSLTKPLVYFLVFDYHTFTSVCQMVCYAAVYSFWWVVNKLVVSWYYRGRLSWYAR